MLPHTSSTDAPFITAHFVLSIDRLPPANFSKCSGLAGELNVEEYQEGGENRFAHRFPTRTSFPNLVLNQGAGPVRDLWDWFYEFYTTGLVVTRNGTVELKSTVNGALTTVRVWAFMRGWPVKLTGPELDAQSSAVAIESIEIAHHGLVLKKAP